MEGGIYLIKFPPKIQSQVSSGFLNITGGVARNQSGQIVSHGANASLISLTPIILYQVGVFAFGAYYLKQINQSLEKINKKLDKIFGFLEDKRSAEISGLLLELSHISKGIIEFNKAFNLTEILTRIDLIKHIRIMNMPNLLHLQKNLEDELTNLKTIEKTSWFKKEKETEALLKSISDYERILVDYNRSLFLDIICTKIDVIFSICSSTEEVKSRLKSQNDQINFSKKKLSEFEENLNNKFSELIKNSFFDSNKIIEKKRKDIKNSWERSKETIPELNKKCEEHIKSIEDKRIIKDNNILYIKNES